MCFPNIKVNQLILSIRGSIGAGFIGAGLIGAGFIGSGSIGARPLWRRLHWRQIKEKLKRSIEKHSTNKAIDFFYARKVF
jgi:hypothetical protein